MTPRHQPHDGTMELDPPDFTTADGTENSRREIAAVLHRIPDLQEITQTASHWRTWSNERIAAAIPFAGDAGREMAEWLAQ